jgi:hypothetical protein
MSDLEAQRARRAAKTVTAIAWCTGFNRQILKEFNMAVWYEYGLI